jgi:putative two-component system response regulator
MRSRILVIDDEADTVRLLEHLLAQWGFTDVEGFTDPTRLTEALARGAPDLIVLDLKMPTVDGFEVMRLLAPWTRGSAPLPVLVLTADASRETKRAALQAGARDFVNKPFDPEEVRLRVCNLLETRHLQLVLQEHGAELERLVAQRTHALERAQHEVVERLAMAAEFRDDDTHRHALRIGDIAAKLGAGLGLPTSLVERMRQAAPLHDIGKIAVPDAILLKRGPLTSQEYDMVKEHTVVGARILSGSTSLLLQLAEQIAATHHERWDGAGYPGGLRGEAIPMAGRIVAVADVFDALSHDRPYRKASPINEAVHDVVSHSGTQFDPAVISVFESLDHDALVTPAQRRGDPITAASGTRSAPEPMLPGRFARMADLV